ncbi:hypothetical protein FGO68_gene427 [Halteria grandinella]|uniref:Uncharacterized protein n=1 Tax=Halteria grandinella TaxID=5974 RepID=A0A8J8NW45_HALGN|nr:hypothetical protein FGO68_gene427 [Halteria grandinella]
MVGIALPILVFANMYLQFRGTIIAIIVSILAFQEAVVGFMIVFKIRRAQPPPKMQFIEKRYCNPDLERQIRIIFEEQQNERERRDSEKQIQIAQIRLGKNGLKGIPAASLKYGLDYFESGSPGNQLACHSTIAASQTRADSFNVSQLRSQSLIRKNRSSDVNQQQRNRMISGPGEQQSDLFTDISTSYNLQSATIPLTNNTEHDENVKEQPNSVYTNLKTKASPPLQILRQKSMTPNLFLKNGTLQANADIQRSQSIIKGLHQALGPQTDLAADLSTKYHLDLEKRPRNASTFDHGILSQSNSPPRLTTADASSSFLFGKQGLPLPTDISNIELPILAPPLLIRQGNSYQDPRRNIPVTPEVDNEEEEEEEAKDQTPMRRIMLGFQNNCDRPMNNQFQYEEEDDDDGGFFNMKRDRNFRSEHVARGRVREQYVATAPRWGRLPPGMSVAQPPDSIETFNVKAIQQQGPYPLNSGEGSLGGAFRGGLPSTRQGSFLQQRRPNQFQENQTSPFNFQQNQDNNLDQLIMPVGNKSGLRKMTMQV